MTRRRVLIVGHPDAARGALANAVDRALDVEVLQEGSVIGALRCLPNEALDLFMVLEECADAPGIDLVQHLKEHALHGSVPVVFVGSEARCRQAAELGSEQTLGDRPSPRAVLEAVRLSLGLDGSN